MLRFNPIFPLRVMRRRGWVTPTGRGREDDVGVYQSTLKITFTFLMLPVKNIAQETLIQCPHPTHAPPSQHLKLLTVPSSMVG